MAATFSREHVCTDGVDPTERVAFWEARSAQTLVGLRCATFNGAPLEARQTVVRLGGLCMTEIAGSAHVIERTAACVRDVPKSAVFASLVLQSDAFFYHGGGCANVGPGDVIVYDTAQPYLFGFPGPMRQFLFDLPAQVLADLGVQSPREPVRYARDSLPGRLHGGALRQVADRLLRTPDDGDLAACRLQVMSVMADLLGAGHRPDRAHSGASGTTHLLAAQAFVERHLGDAQLDANAVASACGISSRHLGRVFAARGMTLAQFIMERRLSRAHAMLLADARAVSQIAYRCGFASASHFARVFRARFGCTPRALRERA